MMRKASARRNVISFIVLMLALSGCPSVLAQETPPGRCAGLGELESHWITTWEAGLEGWTPGTHDVANPATFDTPDWETVGNLPNGQPGMAAFVANLDIGDCDADDESGALNIDSPVIELPVDVEVLRLAVSHWVATEYLYDGGNLKISVNGGPYELVPNSSIDYGNYNGKLVTADQFNTNPLASEPAFTGTEGAVYTSQWGETHVNLTGIAEPGDSVRLRLDFGIDGCNGETGWYVDSVEIYSCSDELAPSPCGNGVIDAGEQCDDGNGFNGDGCSNVCQIENGWTCTAPIPPGNVGDPGFEAGTPNPYWNEYSETWGTPICDSSCGTGSGTGPLEGLYWAWFGGTLVYEEGALSQEVVIPIGLDTLTFGLEASACGGTADYIEARVDGMAGLRIDGSSPLCNLQGYTIQEVDISPYADGGSHTVEFYSEVFGQGGQSVFFVDLVEIPGKPSECTESAVEQTSLTLVKQVVNDDAGNAQASDWTLSATGPTSFSGPGPIVTSSDDFEPGTYALAESGGPDGYEANGWTCAGAEMDGTDAVIVTTGSQVTCTIVNDDVPTPVETSLTLIKQVINDDAGNALASDWTLSATGSTPFSGPGPSVTSGDGFEAGTYSLAESGGPDGYQATGWECAGADMVGADAVIIPAGSQVTCIIVNDDLPASSQIGINAGHSGAWYNPETAGQGVLIDIEPQTQFMFLAWFTYTAADSEHPFEQHWFTAQGNFSGDSAELVLYESSGGQFDDSQAVSTVPVGTVVVSFSDCANGTMSYSFDGQELQGSFPITRAIPGSDDTCKQLDGQATQAVDVNAGMDGAWHNADTSGQGFLIDAYPSGNYMFVAWFTYGEDYASGLRWMTAEGTIEGSQASLNIYNTTDGVFDDPATPSWDTVGTMTIDFADCRTAVVQFTLTNDELSGEIPVGRTIPGSDALCESLQ